MYITTLVFIAFNWSAGGYVNISTTFDSAAKCEQALTDLHTAYDRNMYSIQIGKCY